MDNRDFRDRLRDHKVDADPVAWDQMQGLLDSLPDEKPEKKKRKGGFWLFFAGLGLAAILGTTWFMIDIMKNDDRSMGTNQIIQSSNTQGNKSATKETAETQTKDETIDSNSASLSISDRSNTTEIITGEQTNNFGRSETQEKLQLDNNIQFSQSKSEEVTKTKQSTNTDSFLDQEISKSDSKLLKTRTDDQSESSAMIDEKSISDLSENTEMDMTEVEKYEVSKPESEKGSSIESDRSKRDETERDQLKSTKSVDNDNGGIKVSSSLESKSSTEAISSIESNDKAEETFDPKALSDAKETRGAFLPISRLMLPLGGIISEGKDNIPLAADIKIVTPSRFLMFGGAGYALFNDNPGFIINGGVHYDVDRILDLEANIGYAYGSKQNIPEGEKFTFEKQFDLSFLIHFNFMKTYAHKLSLIAGIGYSFYSGERVIYNEPISINVRSSSGRNLQGAIDYRIRINKKSYLGLRAGVISYDDIVVYFTPRFSYKF